VHAANKPYRNRYCALHTHNAAATACRLHAQPFAGVMRAAWRMVTRNPRYATATVPVNIDTLSLTLMTHMLSAAAIASYDTV
jgi:hypothetical protein